MIDLENGPECHAHLHRVRALVVAESSPTWPGDTNTHLLRYIAAAFTPSEMPLARYACASISLRAHREIWIGGSILRVVTMPSGFVRAPPKFPLIKPVTDLIEPP